MSFVHASRRRASAQRSRGLEARDGLEEYLVAQMVRPHEVAQMSIDLMMLRAQ